MRISYPPALPVAQKRDQIAAAISAHQVVVICGETGSGKTTQLPKICLDIGRGAKAIIGHTQPRRIAARSVAGRIAEELNTPLGQLVGYKVRFSDRIGRDTRIKLMTDGILLAETQGDPSLAQYDTLIIDEAHERSLNIDFLLGYLKQLLPRRRDLKVIITSATIDPQRFSRHFGNAPIIEVSGRMYPVELRYRPLQSEDPNEEDLEMMRGILNAVDELSYPPGDILLFLPGEREIRQTAEALRKHHPPETEILPLYARLSADEQNRIFQPHKNRRIILATNVAETSLTVPGIKYVIDPGYARISRYSPRSKVQRLPIEAVSQASADQRKGRCGRVAPGVCIRLYSEDDYNARPQFTEPEILRTNLASVVLQMKYLRLGDIQDFPFVEPPDYRMIKDGLQTLSELSAIDEHNNLTEIGRELARLPVDPRIGRMILAARRERCMDRVLIIAAALSIQDPRDRPIDKQDAADQAHAAFKNAESDFVGLLNLWDAWHEQARHLSGSKLRKWCKDQFLSFVRMREWHDIHQQLHAIATENGLVQSPAARKQAADTDEVEYEAIHRAVLTGFLANIGQKVDHYEYEGARGLKFQIFPGSGLFAKKPPWVMAGELVETTRLYARTVAKIRPEWVEQAAAHLVKRTWTEPHWNPQSGNVLAFEKVALFGLTLSPRRTVHYGPIDPSVCRELFIHHALVVGEWRTDAPFLAHNRRLIERIEQLEARQRRRDLLVDPQARFAFYDRLIPKDVFSGQTFDKWRRDVERRQPRLLFMAESDLLRPGAQLPDADLFPESLRIDNLKLHLEYRFEPGHADDGLTAIVPLAALNQLSAGRLEWLVPGLLEEKILAMIRSLPKALRTLFVPAPEVAAYAAKTLAADDMPLAEALSSLLSRRAGVDVPPESFDPASLDSHLLFNFKVIDDRGNTLAAGRDLEQIRRQLGIKARAVFQSLPQSAWHRDNVTSWDFGDLPEHVPVKRAGLSLLGYPALVEMPDQSVAMRLFDSPQAAEDAMRGGLRRLFMIQLRPDMRQLERSLPRIDQIALHYAPLGEHKNLKADILRVIVDRALLDDRPPIRTLSAFQDRAAEGWRALSQSAEQVCRTIADTLVEYQATTLLLSKPTPPLWGASIRDMSDQLSHLIYRGFITATPPQWLPHLPRYLKGMQSRYKKLANAGLARDKSNLAQIAPLWEQYKSRAQSLGNKHEGNRALSLYRWMLEEFRISLFAQELKTALPISLRRLADQWAEIRC